MNIFTGRVYAPNEAAALAKIDTQLVGKNLQGVSPISLRACAVQTKTGIIWYEFNCEVANVI